MSLRSSQAERDQLARKVETALRWKLQDAGVDWPLEVEWDEEEITATLSRGELRISDTWRRDPAWWEADQREVLEDLADVLLATQRFYADADEVGYRIAEFEVDGVIEPVQLAPGVRISNGEGAGRRRFYRLGVHRGLLWEEAVREGWVRLL